MKYVLYIVFPILFWGTAKADTIDYWHVYYNQARIKEYNLNGVGDIVLKACNIKKGDVITVRYYTDTPCQDCPVLLTIEDDGKQMQMTVDGKGESAPLTFRAEDLLNRGKSGDRHIFHVYYTEDKYRSNSGKRLIFTIRIE